MLYVPDARSQVEDGVDCSVSSFPERIPAYELDLSFKIIDAKFSLTSSAFAFVLAVNLAIVISYHLFLKHRRH